VAGNSLRRRFGLAVVPAGKVWGTVPLGRNSRNRHLFSKQRRDPFGRLRASFSTPRLRMLYKRQSQGAALKMTAARAEWHFLSEPLWLKGLMKFFRAVWPLSVSR
jgi:hypothetical protein